MLASYYNNNGSFVCVSKIMSEKAANPQHENAKEQRKPRSTRSNRDVHHHQSKNKKDVIGDEKKDVVEGNNKTEPSDSKYCKKEIDNNWNKYETKMETYEEFEKKEKLGADYEELSKIPLSVGNHFQFKHEKVVYDNTPTEYDKHFQCNIDILSAALLSLPFFERNSVPKSIFRPGEMENMTHRSIKFADKYKNMLKRNIEVVASKENNSKLSDTSESKDDPSKGTGFNIMEMLPDKSAVIDEVVKSETSKSTLISIDATLTRDLDVDEQNESVKDVVENILVDNISSAEIDMIASPKLINENPAPKSTEDLEKWLDDFLDG